MSMPSNGTGTPNGSANVDETHLAESLQTLSVAPEQKPKKKRAARAFHSDFNQANFPSHQPPAPVQSPSFQAPSPYQAGAQFEAASPYQSSTPVQPSTPFAPPNGQFPAMGQNDNNFGIPAQNQFAAQQVQADMSHVSQVSHDLSIPEFRVLNQQEYATPIDENNTYRSFLTFNNVKPPDASCQFHAVDQGTASSKYIRSTMYHIPENEQLRAASGLPVSVTIRPFAPLLSTEEPVPVVDMRRDEYPSDDPLDNGPIRCRRCLAYVNPMMQFTQLGKFVCNICQFPNNVVPSDYSAMLDNHGQRIDKYVRPELHKGVYDLIVPKEYNFGGPTKEPSVMHHVFLIDISEQSIKQNLPVVVADAIRATLFNEEQEFTEDFENSETKKKQKFAILAFDKRIHFYNLLSELETTQISINSDLEDPFVPYVEGLFVEADESRNIIEDALNHLELLTMDDHLPDSEPAFSAACRTAMMCLEAVGGGKITSILSSLPSWGPGGLKYKDNKAVGRTLTPEAEQRIFVSDNEYYKLLAKDFIANNVGMDVHVVSPTSVDLSNIGWLSSISGGTVTRFPNFNFERDGRALTAKIVTSIKKARGYQSQLKLRCSDGLLVSQYFGAYVPPGENITGVNIDPKIPILSEDQTITVLLEYDGKLSTKLDCHFQAALLYTDTEGTRKVRVINLVLAVCERLEDVFSFADENAIVTTIVRDCLSFVGKQPLTELRESINKKLVQVFTQYRAMSEYGHNRNRTLTNSLLFPDSLKHLPQYLLSFIKTKAIRSSNSLTADSRLEDLYQMFHMPIERLMYHLYPALVELHSLTETDCMFEDVHGFMSVPKYMELSVKHLQPSAYVLCNGLKVYIWVDTNTNVLLLKDLFGSNVESVNDIDIFSDELPDLNTEISQQTRNLIRFFHTMFIGSPIQQSSGVQIVRPGDAAEIEFKEQLMEDSLHGTVQASSGPSYPEYISNLHKAIRNQLDNDKSSNKVKQSVSSVEHHSDTLAQRLIHF